MFWNCRYYTGLKLETSYKKRVSWFQSENEQKIAVIEYLGIFPELAPHGNLKRKHEYLRTPSYVMEEMSDLLKHKNPTDLHDKCLKNMMNWIVHLERNRYKTNNLMT